MLFLLYCSSMRKQNLFLAFGSRDMSPTNILNILPVELTSASECLTSSGTSCC